MDKYSSDPSSKKLLFAPERHHHRELQLGKMQRTTDQDTQLQLITFPTHSHTQDLRNIIEEGMKRSKIRSPGSCCEISAMTRNLHPQNPNNMAP